MASDVYRTCAHSPVQATRSVQLSRLVSPVSASLVAGLARTALVNMLVSITSVKVKVCPLQMQYF